MIYGAEWKDTMQFNLESPVWRSLFWFCIVAEMGLNRVVQPV